VSKVEGLKGDLEELKCLNKDLRDINHLVKDLKKRPPGAPAVQERDVTLEPTELADLHEEVWHLRDGCRRHKSSSAPRAIGSVWSSGLAVCAMPDARSSNRRR
jgi:hypothetical protein